LVLVVKHRDNECFSVPTSASGVCLYLLWVPSLKKSRRTLTSPSVEIFSASSRGIALLWRW
jgi:hypothetical protein